MLTLSVVLGAALGASSAGFRQPRQMDMQPRRSPTDTDSTLEMTGADAVSPPTSVLLNRVNLSGVDPLAVCVDGTTASYYIEPATTNASYWLVDLAGGAWCWDVESCAQRCTDSPHLCSSADYPEEFEQAGLFLDPELRGANKIGVAYCSSDGWMGDAEFTGGIAQFRGARIVAAVLKDLVATLGLATSGERRDTVILAGHSAGGRGAMANLDYVKGMVAAGGGTQEVDVVGILDSPVWLDEQNYEGNIGEPALRASLQNTTKAVWRYINSPRLGRECSEAYPGEDGWKCMFSQYRLPHIQTPYFLIMPQYDGWQLERRVGRKPSTTTEIAYSVDYASTMTAFLRQLRADWPQDAAMQNAVLAWSCYDHASAGLNIGWFEQASMGRTAMSAFHVFMGWEEQEDDQPSLEWVDTCVGFACGAGCRLTWGEWPESGLLQLK